MKHSNMKIPDRPIERFCTERNLSEKSQIGYTKTASIFEEVIDETIVECLKIADNEKHKDFEDTSLYEWLILFRNYTYNTYKEGTAKLYLTRIKAIFRHYKIPIGDLPYFSTKQARKSEEIDYEDLPNREILKKCIELKNPLLKALTLFMSSSGISKIDTLELTIQDYLTATKEYHNTNNIHQAIHEMENQKVIPVFKLTRRKTGETYRTFASPESVKAINNYLLGRDNLTNDSKLFDISISYINDIFQQTNDKLELGRVNGHRRFCPQMLRSYHASQLSESGMNDSNIDLLQGRKPQSIARKSYIRVKRERLREEYIKALPFLVVEDFEKVKTELDTVKEERDNLLENYNKIWDKINSIEERQNAWDEIKELKE